MKKLQEEDSEPKENPLIQNKKLLRLPYYKLEELKKLEEKKLKHAHKLKKKEEHVQLLHIPQNPHHPHQRESKSVVKGKKIILKKIKEEPETVEEKELYKDLANDNKPHTNNTIQYNENNGDKLKNLKYSIAKVKVKKLRLSKKQRRLQDPENTLASFMSKEDSTILSRKSSNVKFVATKTSVNNVNTSDKNENSCNPLNNNTTNYNTQGTGNTTTNYPDLKILGKKKKRLSKYKKAIYKSRFEKQQFLYSKIFNQDEKVDAKLNEASDGIDEIIEDKRQEMDKVGHGANYIPKLQNKTECITEKVNRVYNYYNSIDNGNINQANWNNQTNQPSPVYPNLNYSYPYNFYYPYYPQVQFHPQMTLQQHYNDRNNKFNPYTWYPFGYANYQGFMCNNFIQYNNNIPSNQGNKSKDKLRTNPSASDTKQSNGFLFEHIKKEDKTKPEITKEEFMKYLKNTYDIDIDISKLNGKELNDFLKEHNDLKRINMNHLKKLFPSDLLDEYMRKYEGIQLVPNMSKKIVREYVDQILDNDIDKKFSEFIAKMRELYNKKKQTNPLKAKKRFVVGMREIEKHIRLDDVKCLFVVPNIEKSEGKNSLDERLLMIFQQCGSKGVPIYFGLNKFKLGQVARKKHSCVSMLALINVEGFEREFSLILEYAEEFRRKFYIKHYDSKELLKDNKFIDPGNFEKYNRTVENKDKP